MHHPLTAPTHRTAARDWVDTIAQSDAAAAAQVQRAIDSSYRAAGSIPVGSAREIAFEELMPMERSCFGRAFADTVFGGAE